MNVREMLQETGVSLDDVVLEAARKREEALRELEEAKDVVKKLKNKVRTLTVSAEWFKQVRDQGL
jgi:hypothetical protein